MVMQDTENSHATSDVLKKLADANIIAKACSSRGDRGSAAKAASLALSRHSAKTNLHRLPLSSCSLSC